MALGKSKRSRQRGYERPKTTNGKEHSMKRVHVTGHKKKPKGSSDWYKQIEEENIRRIEAEWQAKQQGK